MLRDEAENGEEEMKGSDMGYAILAVLLFLALVIILEHGWLFAFLIYGGAGVLFMVFKEVRQRGSKRGDE